MLGSFFAIRSEIMGNRFDSVKKIWSRRYLEAGDGGDLYYTLVHVCATFNFSVHTIPIFEQISWII